MNQLSWLSSGQDLASLVVSSGLLHRSWAEGEFNQTHPSLPLSVKYKASSPPFDFNIIAFASSPSCTLQHLHGEGRDLVSSAEIYPLFQFLCTKGNPSFSIHKAAIYMFAALIDDLSRLKDQLGNDKPLIITGHSIGGSIASLFTLWLLENISPKDVRRPLCITFGSPLIGDYGFQQAILERPTWASCFLHVVSSNDPIPRLFTSPSDDIAMESNSQTGMYKPFGTFLFCSASDCACFDEPESIFELLVAMNQSPNIGLQSIDYGRILEYLEWKAIRRESSELSEWEWPITPHWAGIVKQIEAIGLNIPQQHGSSDFNQLIRKIEDRMENFLTCKRNVFNPNKKLNDRKIDMANLEWYKKYSKDHGGYYDSYKNVLNRPRATIVKHQRKLTAYWEDMVAEAERMPQKEGASFRTRWLYGGTNYRRMVEPLDIAAYYKSGKRDYINQGRSQHYILLEQWLKDDKSEGHQNNANEKKGVCSLTEDSCFWAHVEEAIISCRLLNAGGTTHENEESLRLKLVEFDHYVMNLIANHTVSNEIFLKNSSFMLWWKEYNEYKTREGTALDSPLITFIKIGSHQLYT